MSKCRLAVMIVVILMLMLPLYGCGSGAVATGEPVIFDVETTARNTIATVSWNTTQYATSQLEYGQTTDYGTLTDLRTTLTADHSVSLSGLPIDTTYHFRVRSKNEAGDEGVSKDYTFSTANIIYYTLRGGDAPQVWYRDASSGYSGLIGESIYEHGYTHSWSPDGTKLILTENSSHISELSIMTTDGSINGWSIDKTFLSGSIVWSPDSTKMVLNVDVDNGDLDHHSEIWLIDVDGSNLLQLTDNTISFSWNMNPVWSPDGTRLLFAAELPDETPDLYVVNADGTGLTRLTDTANVTESDPAWSSDGTMICYGAWNDDLQTDEIRVMDADGSNPVLLDADIPSHWYDFEWSPDSTSIIYYKNNESTENAQIWRVNADGTGHTTLTDSAVSSYQPMWSPDGTMISYTAYTDNHEESEIWVMDADGSNPMQITDNTLYSYDGIYDSVWSPAGTRIMFTPGNNEIWVASVDGSGQAKVAKGENPVWAP